MRRHLPLSFTLSLLSNVVSAMGIRSHPLVAHLQLLLAAADQSAAMETALEHNLAG